MTVVVDVGCATHDGEQSIETLLHRFQPVVLYGIDPHPATTSDHPNVVIDRRAAWTHNGRVGYTPETKPTHSFTHLDGDGHNVECFDLAEMLEAVFDRHPGAPVVLKLDCEGAEYPLLDHLIDREVDGRLSLVLVEWHRHVHDCDARRANLEERLACPIEEWT